MTTLNALFETGLGEASRSGGDPLPLRTIEKSSGIGGIALISIFKKKLNRHTRTNFENLNLEFGPVRIEPCDRHGRRVCIKGRSSARLACPCRKAENLSNHHTDFDLIASAVFLWAWCDRPRPGLRHVPRCHEWQSLCIGNTIIWFLMDFIALPMHCSWAIFFARRILH